MLVAQMANTVTGLFSLKTVFVSRCTRGNAALTTHTALKLLGAETLCKTFPFTLWLC